MNAVEFSGKIEEGTIRLPEKYKEYDNSYARVIVLVDKPIHNSAKKEKLKKAFKGMKKVAMFSNIDNPTVWQKRIRDEWT